MSKKQVCFTVIHEQLLFVVLLPISWEKGVQDYKLSPCVLRSVAENKNTCFAGSVMSTILCHFEGVFTTEKS